MKKISILVLSLLMISGCTSSTQYGKCIGVTDIPNPNLDYRVDIGNVIVAIIFSSTVIVPAVVILDQIKCPVGNTVVIHQ